MELLVAYIQILAAMCFFGAGIFLFELVKSITEKVKGDSGRTGRDGGSKPDE